MSCDPHCWEEVHLDNLQSGRFQALFSKTEGREIKKRKHGPYCSSITILKFSWSGVVTENNQTMGLYCQTSSCTMFTTVFSSAYCVFIPPYFRLTASATNRMFTKFSASLGPCISRWRGFQNLIQ